MIFSWIQNFNLVIHNTLWYDNITFIIANSNHWFKIWFKEKNHKNLKFLNLTDLFTLWLIKVFTILRIILRDFQITNLKTCHLSSPFSKARRKQRRIYFLWFSYVQLLLYRYVTSAVCYSSFFKIHGRINAFIILFSNFIIYNSGY